ncbi:MAG: DsbA family protein [Candidatus Krumholzibacteriia bacterium]
MRPATSRFLLAGLILSAASPARPAEAPWTSLLPTKLAAIAKRLVDTGKCPCRCGNYLPGSTQAPTCFGCSVGKAEVSRIVEGLAAGQSRGDVLLEVGEPLLISVFADYADPGLRETWERVVRIAAQRGLHRVVLRTPARTDGARRAVALAEFARDHGRFFEMQRILIDHDGPWDPPSLSGLVERIGLSSGDAERYLGTADVGRQIHKDRQHAELDGIHLFPTIVIQNEIVADSEAAIRRGIQRALLDDSM